MTPQAARVLGIAVAALAIVLAASPQIGVGQDRGRSASPEELWRDYPLKTDEKADDGAPPDGAPGGAEAGRAPPPAGQPGDASSQRSEQGSDDGAMTVLAMAVSLLVLVALFVRRGRPRRALLASSLPSALRPRRPVDAPPAPRTWGALRSCAWTAEIQWRGGDGLPRFCLVAWPPGGEEAVCLLESQGLEWPPRSEAATETLAGAVADLERSAVAAGWEMAGRGASWFATRFVWPRTDRAPAQTLERPEVADHA